MKNHPPIILIVPLIAIAGYLAWALVSGSLRIRGKEEPIRRQTNPQQYWYNIIIFGVIFIIILAVIAWMFL